MANAQLSDSQAAALQELTDLCSKDGLLIRPQGLQDNDMLNGLMDEATLLYVEPSKCSISYSDTIFKVDS